MSNNETASTQTTYYHRTRTNAPRKKNVNKFTPTKLFKKNTIYMTCSKISIQSSTQKLKTEQPIPPPNSLGDIICDTLCCPLVQTLWHVQFGRLYSRKRGRDIAYNNLNISFLISINKNLFINTLIYKVSVCRKFIFLDLICVIQRLF